VSCAGYGEGAIAALRGLGFTMARGAASWARARVCGLNMRGGRRFGARGAAFLAKARRVTCSCRSNTSEAAKPTSSTYDPTCTSHSITPRPALADRARLPKSLSTGTAELFCPPNLILRCARSAMHPRPPHLPPRLALPAPVRESRPLHALGDTP
jgi:hypothetical protein